MIVRRGASSNGDVASVANLSSLVKRAVVRSVALPGDFPVRLSESGTGGDIDLAGGPKGSGARVHENGPANWRGSQALWVAHRGSEEECLRVAGAEAHVGAIGFHVGTRGKRDVSTDALFDLALLPGAIVSRVGDTRGDVDVPRAALGPSVRCLDLHGARVNLAEVAGSRGEEDGSPVKPWVTSQTKETVVVSTESASRRESIRQESERRSSSTKSASRRESIRRESERSEIRANIPCVDGLSIVHVPSREVGASSVGRPLAPAASEVASVSVDAIGSAASDHRHRTGHGRCIDTGQGSLLVEVRRAALDGNGRGSAVVRVAGGDSHVRSRLNARSGADLDVSGDNCEGVSGVEEDGSSVGIVHVA